MEGFGCFKIRFAWFHIMNILILEDNEERHKVFRRNMDISGVNVVIFEHVNDCIKALNDKEWDMLFLDHDLGGEVFVESDGKVQTGWHVAKWLNENPDRQPPRIFLHSLNPDGRKNMQALLPKATSLPFAWDLVKITDV